MNIFVLILLYSFHFSWACPSLGLEVWIGGEQRKKNRLPPLCRTNQTKIMPHIKSKATIKSMLNKDTKTTFVSLVFAVSHLYLGSFSCGLFFSVEHFTSRMYTPTHSHTKQGEKKIHPGSKCFPLSPPHTPTVRYRREREPLTHREQEFLNFWVTNNEQ